MITACLIGIMIAAGLVGASVSTALSTGPRTAATWRRNAVLGLGASFLVPLFLQTVSSDLLTKILNQSTEPVLYFVFGSFCLLSAISAKKFITSLTEKTLNDIKEAKRIADEAKAEVNQVKDKADQTQNQMDAVTDQQEYNLSKAPAAAQYALLAPGFPDPEPGNVPDDPWAGQFGGVSESSGRKLEARINALTNRPGWCAVTLRVFSIDAATPLEGSVYFFLHRPTFENYKPKVAVRDGEARLSFMSWGAFTVGAVCDPGAVRLELDLSKHKDAPEPWRSL